ncbi:hypothetical protein AYK61_26990 [Rhodococcus sp. SBT000017]|nr:hypothetical protein AYK61_26990 [Rhodococcus sp. SBT000017]
MQSEEAAKLQKDWIAKGNPPCAHPETSKEYFLGSATGDRVCKTCGADIPRTPPTSTPSTIVIDPENIRKGDSFEVTGFPASGGGPVTSRHTALRIEDVHADTVTVVVHESVDRQTRRVIHLDRRKPILVERASPS